MSKQNPLTETRELGTLLHRAAALGRADFGRAAESLGLTAPMARVLLMLKEPTPMRRIAEFLVCDASYVTGVADQLEAAGLAKREDGAGRRVRLLAATKSGAAVRARIPKAVSAESTALGVLDDASRAQLTELLQRLVDASPRKNGSC